MKTLIRKPAKKAELTRRDPFFDFTDWPEFTRFFDRPNWPVNLFKKNREFYPTMDVYKKEGFVFLELDLPGMVKKDIKVMVEGADLIVEGERKEETEVKDEEFFKMERAMGAFYRRVTLGFEVDPKDVKAEFKNGVLKVRVPYLFEEKEEAKTVPIS